MTPRKVISLADAERLTTIKESTWCVWAHRGRKDVPQSFKLAGRRVLFEDEVVAWMESQRDALDVVDDIQNAPLDAVSA